MPTDLTGTPTTLGIGTYNVDADAPSGLGFNEAMAQIDALIAARVGKPAGIATGEVPVWNGTGWDRSSATRIGAASLGSGTPDATKFLRGDGSWQAVAAGSLIGVQVIAATATYTPTSGTTKVYVEAVGGGGGGGGSGNPTTSAGGGGGSGAYAASLLTSGFSGLTATIGAAGAGGPGAANGSPGGTTSLGSLVVAVGGAGGIGSSSQFVLGGAGGAAASCTGTLRIDGSAGDQGAVSGAFVYGGPGGNSHFGAGARPAAIVTAASTAVSGNNATAPGGGGNGGASNNSAAVGGNGAPGLIRIWEFA